jgi:hypothetical protein
MNRFPLVLSVALLISAGPAAAAVSNGTYKGSTNQNYKAHAKVKGGKLASLSFGVFTRCGLGGSDGFNIDALAVKGVKIKKGGAYKVTQKGTPENGKATFTLKGKVTKAKVTGSVERFARGNCQAFDLKFTAKRR